MDGVRTVFGKRLDWVSAVGDAADLCGALAVPWDVNVEFNSLV